MTTKRLTWALAIVAGIIGMASAAFALIGPKAASGLGQSDVVKVADEMSVPKGAKVATFASGCFWCTESDFDKVEGVLKTISGYTGGKTKNPTYEQVTRGNTGHVEAVRVVYDPSKVSYEKLVEYYWRHVDFTDDGGQFCDRGSSYKPVIFVNSPEQAKVARDSKKKLQMQFKQKVVVPIREAQTFTPAEDYHQDFYKKKPYHYYRYRTGCGRDARVKALWATKSAS